MTFVFGNNKDNFLYKENNLFERSQDFFVVGVDVLNNDNNKQ